MSGEMDSKLTALVESFDILYDQVFLEISNASSRTAKSYTDHNQELHQATIAELLPRIKKELQVRDEKNNTLLHVAAELGKTNIINLLIQTEADVNAVNLDGETPLTKAVIKGMLPNVELLLVNGADVKVQNKEGQTLVHIAVQECKYEMLKLLLDNGADVKVVDNKKRTALYYYKFGNADSRIIKLLEERGIDPAVEDNQGIKFTDIKDDFGNTPLHIAASASRLREVEFLVRNGADVNAINNLGENPLQRVCYPEHPEALPTIDKERRERDKKIIDLLVSKGADIEARDLKGRVASGKNTNEEKFFFTKEVIAKSIKPAMINI